jgi:preprotein translocase subunit SecG
MFWLRNVLTAVQFLSALGVIGLVLLQHGKGADMGAAFGSGSSGSLFGASGSANFLSRMTAVLVAIFMLGTLALTYLGSYHPKANVGAGLLGSVASAPASAPALAASAASLPAAPSPAQGVPK